MKGHHSGQRGFTIVELLIVVTVIGILVAITAAVFNNVQQRSRDNERAHDMTILKKGLLLYQAQFGGVPRVSAYGGSDGGGWDSSSAATPWMSFLTASYGGPPPVDPINAPNAVGTGDPTQGGQSYYYHCYLAGAGPNPATANVRMGYWSERTGARVNVDVPVESCL